MADYEQSKTIGAPPGDVFAWLSDVGNLRGYLPPVTDASVEGPSAEGAPGQRAGRATPAASTGGCSPSCAAPRRWSSRRRPRSWGSGTTRRA